MNYCRTVYVKKLTIWSKYDIRNRYTSMIVQTTIAFLMRGNKYSYINQNLNIKCTVIY